MRSRFLLLLVSVLACFGGATPPAIAEPSRAPAAGSRDGVVAAVHSKVAGLAADGVWRRVTVAAVGDVSLARELNERMAEHGAAYPFVLIRERLSADILVGNLEGALTTWPGAWPKAYTFSTPPPLAVGLSWAGFDVVALANNHTMDFGVPGLLDTLDTLEGLGVAHPGAGRNAAEALAPVFVDHDGLRTAFISVVLTPNEWTGFSICAWEASEASPGLAIGSPAGIAAAVTAARSQADFVIVLVHAGTEYSVVPDRTQEMLFAAAVSAGATAVIGSHSHTVQPVSWGGPGTPLLAWSLGNFVFDLDEEDLAAIPEPRYSLVLSLVLAEGIGVAAWDGRPVVIDSSQDRPRPATAEEAVLLDAALSADRGFRSASADVCP